MTADFGIYIHWPWCVRLCPYCDFNVYLARTAEPEPLITAICEDIACWREQIGSRRVVSVFFGGGTPSLAPPRAIAQILETIAHGFSLAADAEISLEANPEDYQHFASLVSTGINRLSLGVQSLRDEELQLLGRTHSAATARKAISMAQTACDNVSIDLIYALPGQTLSDWSQQLRAVLGLGLEHLSLYTLTIAQGTAFGYKAERGALAELDDADSARLYEITQDLTQRAGLPAYEVSNHAASRQIQCRHNRLYWQGGDWLGLGPGAHGRLTLDGTRHATETKRKPAEYVAATNFSERFRLEALSEQDTAKEYLLMGLRLVEGLALPELTDKALAPELSVLEELLSLELIQLAKNRLALTSRGRLLADAVVRKLME